MKILLVYPHVLHERVNEEDVSVPPIGIYYVGAVLKEAGHEVEILNTHPLKNRPGQIERVVRDWRPELVGFSVLHANRWGAVDIARMIKRVLPRVHVVFGGIGATSLWDQLLRDVPDLDYVVLGEGERTFLELANSLESGRTDGLEFIKGLAFRRGGEPFDTGGAPPIGDLDSLPNPARYFTYNHVAATRGCAMKCSFCGSPEFWGREVRAHSPEYFVEQLELLYQKGVRFFYFSDDTFTADRRRVLAIARLILEKGLRITWFAIARVDHVDEEMLRWMRRAGCIQISYGVESGSPEVRKRLGKPLREETIVKAFSMTARAGILPRAYFIYGCPGETDASIEETLALIRKIRPLAAIFYILEIFPGTALHDELARAGRLDPGVWRKRLENISYFELDPAIGRDKVVAWGRRLREGFYGELGRIARTLETEAGCPEDAALYGDFLSRLAMTFSHGDYSRVEAVLEKEKVAETLYEKALALTPDHRAFLGLSVLKQKQGDHEGAVRLLEQGLRHFPGSDQLGVCLGLSLMNLGRLRTALEVFEGFPDSGEARARAENCRGLLSGQSTP